MMELQKKQITIFPLHNITILDLSDNLIEEIPQTACKLNNLKMLILNQNKLAKFDVFIPNLESLSVANNLITTYTFDNMKLRVLNIKNNPFQIYRHHDTLDELQLSWFAIIDLAVIQKRLLCSSLGTELREWGEGDFVKFANKFSTFTPTMLNKAIQYGEEGIIETMLQTQNDILSRASQPQPLLLSAKLNLRIFDMMIKVVNPQLRMLRVILFWAVNKMEIEIIKMLIEKRVPDYNPIWDNQTSLIASTMGINLKCTHGDTPIHLLVRRSFTDDSEQKLQHQIIVMLSETININQKNLLKQAPIHLATRYYSLQVLRGVKNVNFTIRCGDEKDTALHIAANSGNLFALTYFQGKVSAFTVNRFNKTAKYFSNSSICVIKNLRRMEFCEIFNHFHKKVIHFSPSKRNQNNELNFILSLEHNLYEMLLNDDYILQEKLLFVVILNLIKFKELHRVQFRSERAIQPIHFVNSLNRFDIKPNVQYFRNNLNNMIRQARLSINQSQRDSISDLKRKLSNNLSVDLQPIQNINDDFYDISIVYQQIGLSCGQSNRTAILEYEDFQQKSFRDAQLQRPRIKDHYYAKHSPLPRKYTYQDYLKYRSEDQDCVFDNETHTIRSINTSARKPFLL